MNNISTLWIIELLDNPTWQTPTREKNYIVNVITNINRNHKPKPACDWNSQTGSAHSHGCDQLITQQKDIWSDISNTSDTKHGLAGLNEPDCSDVTAHKHTKLVDHVACRCNILSVIKISGAWGFWAQLLSGNLHSLPVSTLQSCYLK